MKYLAVSGLLPDAGDYYGEAVPAFLKDKVINFAQSLIDKKDGYAYHPQWGKNISTSRRSRDIGWVSSILERHFKVKPRYKTAIRRLKEQREKDEKNTLLPEHLSSPENFKEYLRGFEHPENKYCVYKWTYGFTNHMTAQREEILAAGDEYADILFDWLDGLSSSKKGSWSNVTTPDSQNSSIKFEELYARFGRPVPFAKEALFAEIEHARRDELPSWVGSPYGVWYMLNLLLGNVKHYGDAELYNDMKEELIKSAPDLIRSLRRKVEVFKKPDGAFSYYPSTSISGSQRAPVAPAQLPEGDVNANTIATTGILSNICEVLGIPTIPLFCPEDSEIFLELMEKARPVVKTEPIPAFLAKRPKEKQFN